MISDGLLFHDNGDIEVYVNIQDGIERCGTFRNESEAVASYKLGHKVMNNCDREPKRFKVVMQNNYSVVQI